MICLNLECFPVQQQLKKNISALENDDDKIKQLFDANCSNLEIDDSSDDESDFDIPGVQQGLEETEDTLSEILDEGDSDDEPLSVVRERILA
ncbi:hypothetical protein JTB14_020042 [Gonioctena quinquepunctata]|nr:hypothetical protein JTB14_020042 [Gonioctena quinquepunctata]